MGKNLLKVICTAFVFLTFVSPAFCVPGSVLDTVVTDSQVMCMTAANGQIYIGGYFTGVGPYTGQLAEINGSTGIASPNLPVVEGYINAIQPDGSGGWYVGGSFTWTQYHGIRNLAHFNSDATVDLGFYPNPEGQVLALKKSGNLLYVGGYFNYLYNTYKYGLSAIDTTTYQPVTTLPVVGSAALSIDVYGNTVYVVGYFTDFGGLPRNHLACFDSVSKTVLPWNPNPAGYVYTVKQAGPNTICVGGNFTTIGGGPATNFAALNQSGVLIPSTVSFNSQVYDIESYGNTIYVSGYFNQVNAVTHQYLAALALQDLTLLPWNPGPNSNVYTIAIDGTTLYTGGYFTTIDSQQRNQLAAFNADTGALLPMPSYFLANYGFEKMAAAGGKVMCGGDIRSSKVKARNRAASFNPVTNEISQWNPDADGAVYKLLQVGDNIILGGDFNNVCGASRQGIAMVDAAGNTTAWNPQLDSGVYAMEAEGNTLYVGGSFYSLAAGTVTRQYFAAIDTRTAEAMPWSMDFNSTVQTIKKDGSTMYVGGYFTMVNSTDTRHYLAAIDLAGQALLPWNPDADSQVMKIDIYGNTVFACGYFTNISAQPRSYIAAIDKATGAVSAWNAGANNGVRGIFIQGNRLYAVGDFDIFSGYTTTRLCMVDLDTMAPITYFNDINGSPYSVLPVGPRLYLGGSLYSINDHNAANFIGIEIPDSTIYPAATPTPVPTATPVPVSEFRLQKNIANISRGEGILIRPPDSEKGKQVKITVYTRQGKLIRTIEGLFPDAGLTWDGKNDNGVDIGAGVYIIRVETDGLKATLKAVIVK